MLEGLALGWVSRMTPRKIVKKWPGKGTITSGWLCMLDVLIWLSGKQNLRLNWWFTWKVIPEN